MFLILTIFENVHYGLILLSFYLTTTFYGHYVHFEYHRKLLYTLD